MLWFLPFHHAMICIMVTDAYLNKVLMMLFWSNQWHTSFCLLSLLIHIICIYICFTLVSVFFLSYILLFVCCLSDPLLFAFRFWFTLFIYFWLYVEVYVWANLGVYLNIDLLRLKLSVPYVNICSFKARYMMLDHCMNVWCNWQFCYSQPSIDKTTHHWVVT